ncbi:MAG: hypothetical protein ABIO61_01100 [Thermomonas sp.]
MNANNAIATLVLLTVAFAVSAQEPSTTLPGVKAQAIQYVFDCQRRTLPSQRLVGEWTGQHNFSQVYHTRARLMGDVARACNKPGTDSVDLVLERQPVRITGQQPRWVASVEPSGR